MKKLIALLAIVSFALVSDANAWGCRKNCGAVSACPVEVREQPEPICTRQVISEVRECPQKFVDISYACPASCETNAGGVRVTKTSGKSKGY